MLFRGRHFRDETIVLCLGWYVRYFLSYRNLEDGRARSEARSFDHCPLGTAVCRRAERADSIGDHVAGHLI